MQGICLAVRGSRISQSDTEIYTHSKHSHLEKESPERRGQKQD